MQTRHIALVIASSLAACRQGASSRLLRPDDVTGRVTISTCEELQAINEDLAGDYVLGADIDCAESATWNGGEGFEPLGEDAPEGFGVPFSGTFDGGCHVIRDLTMVVPANRLTKGLFGSITGTVHHLGVDDARVSGAPYAGGILAGTVYGTVSSVWTSGAIQASTGPGGATGGLVGALMNAGLIEDAYSLASVSGRWDIGGLLGRMWTSTDAAYVVRSYAAGDVTGSGIGLRGGFIGRNNPYGGGGIYDSFSVSGVSGLTAGGFAGVSKGVLSNVWYNHVPGETPGVCAFGLAGTCSVYDDLPYFYDIDNEPMNGWNYVAPWSDANDGVALPALRTTGVEGCDEPTCTDVDGDGFNVEGGACGELDCDDADAEIYPDVQVVSDPTGLGDVGECALQIDRCDGAIGVLVTVQEAVGPSEETCDGLDNDCDGLVNELDADGDGVEDCSADRCAGSVPDDIEANPNQYAQNDLSTSAFEVGPSQVASVVFDMETTFGCTCAQIVAATGAGAGHLKKGCSPGLMEVWTGLSADPDW